MWVVTIISPWEEPREHVLKAGKTMLGRHPGNDIVIPDDAASRLHAEIEYDLISNAVAVRDMDSTNGTWVNRQRIVETQLLRSDDQVHIGQHLLTLLQRDHNTSGQTAKLHDTQPLAHQNVRQSIDRRAPVLYEVANRLNSIVDLPIALAEVSRLARVALSADYGRVILAGRMGATTELGLPRAILREAMETRTTIVVADLAAEPRYGPVPAPIRAALCVPGLVESEVISLTSIYRMGANSKPFDEFDVELAVAISHEVALNVARIRLLEKAQVMAQQATTDPLTGLPNRRHFLTLAEHEFRRARRYRRPLVALMVDIDGLKDINERNGHAAGDQVLRAVADGCSANLREPHLLCRYGDNAFVVLLLECETEGGAVVAERLRRQVTAAPIDTMTGPIKVRLSTGFAPLDETSPDITALIQQAELNLYASRTARQVRPAAPSPGALS
ncbi:MAG: diguanylate cyclase [Anaerolineales bacterium]|nr:diguanylate cyclase [Anaerolineales bacterium]